MPKVPAYTLAWSPATEVYELYQTRDREGLGIVPESPTWFAWLDQVSSFAFVGKRGHYTARKEAKQRGDRYWSAYLTTGEQLAKKYLGKTADLSLARLEHIAGMLRVQSDTSTPPPISSAARTDGEMDAIPRPLPAQRDNPLHPLLSTKLHAPRPRTHLVLRAHLVRQLQQAWHARSRSSRLPPGLANPPCLPNGSWRAAYLSPGFPWKQMTTIPRAFSPT